MKLKKIKLNKNMLYLTIFLNIYFKLKIYGIILRNKDTKKMKIAKLY